MATRTFEPSSRFVQPARPVVSASAPQLQGKDGLDMIGRVAELVREWTGYEERGLLERPSEEEVYGFILPHRSITVEVDFEFSGRGDPLPYPFEDED